MWVRHEQVHTQHTPSTLQSGLGCFLVLSVFPLEDSFQCPQIPLRIRREHHQRASTLQSALLVSSHAVLQQPYKGGSVCCV